MATVSLKNATLTLKASSGTAVVVKFGDGNATWKETVNNEYRLDRGNLSTVRRGDDVPVELTINSELEKIIGGSHSLTEILKGKGAYAGKSTSTDPCEPYCCDAELKLDPECQAGGAQAELVLFPQFRYDSLDFDIKAGTLNVAGKCNVTEPTISTVAPTGASPSAS